MEIQAKKVLLQNTEGEIVVPVIDPNEVGSGGGWVPSIFQPFWSDHKLNRVDMLRGNTFSWQSGNVYIACYNKLLEEWTDKNANVTLNIDKIGNTVVAKNGVATGFSSENYLQKAIALGNTKEDVFPIITEFTTGNDVFTAQQILVSDSLAFSIFITNNKLAISLGSNKTTYNITNQSKGVTELEVNTNYRAILDYDGIKYTLTLINLDSEDLTPSTELIIESDKLITTEVSKIVVGVTLDKQAPFLGSIRVSRLRIGTSYHVQTKCVSSNGFIMVDENHEQDVDNEYKRTGVAWYYIFDEVGKKFKLPRTKYGFVSTRDNVGEPVLTNLATGNNATDTQMYLYFYVGEFAQTALEENAGLNVELFNDKADRDLGNLTKEGEAKLGKGGLELCDIGMALYVDETKGLRRYLNGQIVDINTNTQSFLNRLQQITTLHPSLLCTEEEWQTAKTMSAFGQVGKFVFNYSGDEIVSVRIPRVVNVQGLFDLQKLGMTVSAGLPNITGSFRPYGGNALSVSDLSGAFSARPNGSTVTSINGSTGTANTGANFDASLSNPIYGNSTTVQPEAIQYPYFIQIATGSETENNIINEIELNNPYSLFDSKYSDHELNNLSWLKSSGQWNAKSVYTDAYDKLLKVQNGTETVEGLSVKLSTETYTDYDFVLNTAEETFRLPLLDGSESLPSETIIKQTFGTDFNLPYNAFVFVSAYSSDANSDGVLKVILPDDTVTHTIWQHDTGYNIYTSPLMPKGTKVITSGGTSYIGVGYYKARGNGSLYFYVGETVQNANLIDAGRIGEQLANKADISLSNLSAVGQAKFDAKVDLNFNNMNPSQTAKNTIVGWCMPDYSATIIVSSLPYTAPTDGQFCWVSGVSTYCSIKINGVDVTQRGELQVGRAMDNSTLIATILISKGDIISLYAGSFKDAYFFPLKGAN